MKHRLIRVLRNLCLTTVTLGAFTAAGVMWWQERTLFIPARLNDILGGLSKLV